MRIVVQVQKSSTVIADSAYYINIMSGEVIDDILKEF